MIRLFGVTLLLLSPLLGAPQFDDNHTTVDAAEDVDAAIPWSHEEEATTRHLVLEDPASWSASTEVLDENHAWYRRRRSVDGEVIGEVSVEDDKKKMKDDLDAAESVVFMPALLRKRKKAAHTECLRGDREFVHRKRHISNRNIQIRSFCNDYCCFQKIVEL